MNEQELIAATKQLIRIQSTADNPQELAKAIALVRGIVGLAPGVTIEEFEDNGKLSFLAYIGKRRPDEFKVLLNGHVDVVAARPEQFRPHIDGDRFYGRGTLDMKTTALVLADIFCRTAPYVAYPLGLQIVSDEEVGGANGTLYQIKQGVRAGFVVAGEFTPPATICNESRGICWLQVDFEGVAAHGAYLWNGHNALLDAQKFVSKLLEYYPIPRNEGWETTVNVASLSTTNSTINRVPDNATLLLDIRYVPGDAIFTSEKSMLAFMSKISSRTQPQAKFTVLEFEPSHFADQKNSLAKKLSDSLRNVTGKPTNFIRKQGAADVRYYAAQGSAAVVFGLSGKGLHGDNEFVEISSIKPYQRALESFLRGIED